MKCLVVYRKVAVLHPVVFKPMDGETLDEWELTDYKDCQLVSLDVYFKRDDEPGRRRIREFYAADEVSRVTVEEDGPMGEMIWMSRKEWLGLVESIASYGKGKHGEAATMLVEWMRGRDDR